MNMLFGDIPQKLRGPSEPIVRAADVRGNCRFSLTRAWGSGPCILWCGLNPSDADGTRDDPTMWREMGFSYRGGFGSLIKVNIYPFRSPHPRSLRRWRETWDDTENPNDISDFYEMHPTSYNAWLYNMDIIGRIITKTPDMPCVAAWGNGVRETDLMTFLERVMIHYGADGDTGDPPIDMPVKWKCLGTTKDGSPKHTLARGHHRIPDDAKLQDWKEP